MNDPFFFPYLGCLLGSAIIALIYRRHLRGRSLIIMVPYLVLVFIMEAILAWYLNVMQRSTTPVYNFYKPVSVIVFAVVYYTIPFMTVFRKAIITIMLVYLGSVSVTYLFLDSLKTSNLYLTLARGLCITIFAVFFLFSYFNLDNLKEERYWRPLIWFTIGVLAFYPVVSISLGFFEYLRDYNATFLGLKLYQVIPRFMSIIMYSCFGYAFYLCRKTR